MNALLLILILVPAPKLEPVKPHPLIGVWAIDWGADWECPIRQTTFFYPDGACYSPQYDGGYWSIDADGRIWFSERDGRNPYVMLLDFVEGVGEVRAVNAGGLGSPTLLKVRRGEYLMMPRVVE